MISVQQNVEGYQEKLGQGWLVFQRGIARLIQENQLAFGAELLSQPAGDERFLQQLLAFQHVFRSFKKVVPKFGGFILGANGQPLLRGNVDSIRAAA